MPSPTKPFARIIPRDSELPLLLRRPAQFVVKYRWTLLVLWAGASADLWTTLRNLEAYGPGIEVHIPQRLLSEWLGVGIGVPLAKLVQLAFVLALAAWWRPWCRWILIVCGVFYAAAAISNQFLLI